MKTFSQAKIMRNAWYLKRIRPTISFASSLRQAWHNERLALLNARIESRDLGEEEARANETSRGELLTVPADYYGEANRYYGD